MMAGFAKFALRLALCLGLSGLAWHFGGVGALIGSLLFWGFALARPIVELASDVRHAYRREHWRDLEGRHCVFRGVPVSMLEDADHRRWIRMADVRTIVGFTASDATLKVTYPDGCRALGRPASLHLSDEALVAHLAKERAPIAAKFHRWLEREIAFPARRQRAHHGIRMPAPDFRESGGS
jgi:hypothetical protein